MGVSILVILDVALKHHACEQPQRRRHVSILVILDVALKPSAEVVRCIATEFQSLLSWMSLLNRKHAPVHIDIRKVSILVILDVALKHRISFSGC